MPDLLEPRHAVEAHRVGVFDIVRSALSLVRRSVTNGWSVWLGAILILLASDAFTTFGARSEAASLSPVQLGSLAVRLVGLLWVNAAAYRAMLCANGQLWSLDRRFLRYVALALSIFAFSIVVQLSVRAYVRPFLYADITNQNLARAIWLAADGITVLLTALIAIRLTLWLPELATNIAPLGLAEFWKRTGRVVLPLIGAWIILIVPLFAAHFLFNVWAQGAIGDGSNRLWFAAVGAALSAVLLFFALSSIAAAYRLGVVAHALNSGPA